MSLFIVEIPFIQCHSYPLYRGALHLAFHVIRVYGLAYVLENRVPENVNLTGLGVHFNVHQVCCRVWNKALGTPGLVVADRTAGLKHARRQFIECQGLSGFRLIAEHTVFNAHLVGVGLPQQGGPFTHLSQYFLRYLTDDGTGAVGGPAAYRGQ